MSLVKNRLRPGLLLWNPWPHITCLYTYRHYVLYLRCSRVYFANKTCYRAYFAYKTVIEPILTINQVEHYYQLSYVILDSSCGSPDPI